jgi:hypothetical protein
MSTEASPLDTGWTPRIVRPRRVDDQLGRLRHRREGLGDRSANPPLRSEVAALDPAPAEARLDGSPPQDLEVGSAPWRALTRSRCVAASSQARRGHGLLRFASERDARVDYLPLTSVSTRLGVLAHMCRATNPRVGIRWLKIPPVGARPRPRHRGSFAHRQPALGTTMPGFDRPVLRERRAARKPCATNHPRL